MIRLIPIPATVHDEGVVIIMPQIREFDLTADNLFRGSGKQKCGVLFVFKLVQGPVFCLQSEVSLSENGNSPR